MAKKKKAKAKAARGGKVAAGKARKPPKARKSVTARKAVKKASRPSARPAKKRAPVRAASRKPNPRASKKSEMFGEGNWKADERYRESLRRFSKTHDVEALARKAALDLEPDLRRSDDGDVADSARRGAQEEPEW